VTVRDFRLNFAGFILAAAMTCLPVFSAISFQALDSVRDGGESIPQGSGRAVRKPPAGDPNSLSPRVTLGPATAGKSGATPDSSGFARLSLTGLELKALRCNERIDIGSTQGESPAGAERTLNPLGEGWPPSDFAGSGDTGRSVGVPGPHNLVFGVGAARKDVHIPYGATGPQTGGVQAAGEPETLRRAGIKPRRLLQSQDILREIKYGMLIGAANLCGVDLGLAISLGMRESGLIWPERRHEAVGFFQVKPSTARGVSPTLNPYTAWGNMVAGLCYLRQMKDRDKTWEAALLSYRLGPYRARTTREAHAYVADIVEAQ